MLTDDAEKALAALHRGIPITRMIDYGMNRRDAESLAALQAGPTSWDAAASGLADRRVSSADDLERRQRRMSAAAELEWAAAALSVGQIVFNFDTSLKRAMLDRAAKLLARAADLGGFPCERLVLKHDDGTDLYGWLVGPRDAKAAVVVIGGLSGWGSVYLALARSFAAIGITAVLAVGPGQGETRANGGPALARETLHYFSPFIDLAARIGGGRVGLVGMSYGGLIVAHLAAMDDRVRACCINGAPPRPFVPDFRTAREQLEAAFGASGDRLEDQVAGLTFDPVATPIRGALLIVEGGADPLVPLGSQAGFATPTKRDVTTLAWPDGEHTIYNYADDRDDLIAAWFSDCFASGEQE